jgi:hypothetical protein
MTTTTTMTTKTRSKRALFLLLSLASWSLAACPGFGDNDVEGVFSEVPAEVNYEEHVAPMMARYCNKCHGATPSNGAPGSFRLDVCDDSGGEPGARSRAARHAARVASQDRPMPPASDSNPVGGVDQQVFARWVACGSPCAPEDPNTCPTGEENNANNANSNPNNANNPNNNAGAASFEEVKPIFDAGCNFPFCHGEGGEPGGGLFLTSLEQVLAKPGSVVPCDPTTSEVFLRLTQATAGSKNLMPLGGPELSAEEVEAVRAWIEAGSDLAPLCGGSDNNEPPPPLCEGLDACRQACDDPTAQSCIFECVKEDQPCRACVVAGFNACSQQHCPDERLSFLSCYQDCKDHPNGAVWCFGELCPEQWATFEACVRPQVEAGACDAGFGDCPL